jgi:hypothetical protein
MRPFTCLRAVCRLARRPRATLCCAALLALAALLVVGCGDGGTSSAPSDGSSPSVGTSNLVDAQTVKDLIAPRDVSFCVGFTSEGQYPFTGSEYLFWRQGNRMARWDIVQSGSEEPASGWISIVSDIPGSVSLPYTSMGCLWFRQRSPGPYGTPQARLSCSEGARLPDLLSLVMPNDITEQLPDNSVAGRKASCYSFDNPMLSVGEFCVDSQGIPLLLSTVSRRDLRLTQETRAVSVSTAEQELEFPVELQRSPVDGWWVFEGVVPISTLQLPDLSQFEE